MAEKPNTDAIYRNKKPKEKTFKISDGGGLFLEIKPNGGKYWRFPYRFNGKQKTLAIGVYPEISLTKARKARESAREQLREGIDPSEQKRVEKALKLEKAGNTFEKIARHWHSHMSGTWQLTVTIP